MSPCLCPHLLPTQGWRALLVWTVHVLLSSVPLGRHPGQILLGRSDYALGHLASHMPRSCWHHTHPGSLGSDTLEGLCDLVSLICLPGFQVLQVPLAKSLAWHSQPGRDLALGRGCPIALSPEHCVPVSCWARMCRAMWPMKPATSDLELVVCECSRA